jgi:hypothetical protein
VTGARPPHRHADDGRDPSDADRAAELRSALQRVLPVLAYCAGREAADDSQQAAVVLAAADAVTGALARTAPHGTRSPLEAGTNAADLGITPTTGPSCEGVRDLIVALLTSHHLVSHAAALREPRGDTGLQLEIGGLDFEAWIEPAWTRCAALPADQAGAAC